MAPDDKHGTTAKAKHTLTKCMGLPGNDEFLPELAIVANSSFGLPWSLSWSGDRRGQGDIANCATRLVCLL